MKWNERIHNRIWWGFINNDFDACPIFNTIPACFDHSMCVSSLSRPFEAIYENNIYYYSRHIRGIFMVHLSRHKPELFVHCSSHKKRENQPSYPVYEIRCQTRLWEWNIVINMLFKIINFISDEKKNSPQSLLSLSRERLISILRFYFLFTSFAH